MKKIKKYILPFISIFFFSQIIVAQKDANAKKILDAVSATMTSYKNMQITFKSSLSNEDAGIKDGDEPAIPGKILLSGEKYKLDYLGTTFIFNGAKL